MKDQSRAASGKKSDYRNVELLVSLQKVVPGGLNRLKNQSKAIKKSIRQSQAKAVPVKEASRKKLMVTIKLVHAAETPILKQNSSESRLNLVKVREECYEKHSEDKEGSMFSFGKMCSTQDDNMSSSIRARQHQEETLHSLPSCKALGPDSQASLQSVPPQIDLGCDPDLQQKIA